MQKRILSFVLLWVVVFLVPLFLGEFGAVILITVAALLTQWEIYRLLADIGPKATVKMGCLTGLFVSIGSYYGPAIGLEFASVFGLATVAIVLGHLFRPLSKRVFQAIGATLFGLALAPLLLGFFGQLILLGGIPFAVWIIAVAKFADVGALLTGMAIGRTKLAPNLSPNKTREGAAGGVVWSVVIGVGSVALFPEMFPSSLTPLWAGLIAIPVSIVGIASDLFESAVKREAGKKDSGQIFPGIGGAFDLTDSLLLAAPVGYVLLHLVVS